MSDMRMVPTGTRVTLPDGQEVVANGRVFRFPSEDLRICADYGSRFIRSPMFYNGHGDFMQFAFCPQCPDDEAVYCMPKAMTEFYDRQQDVQ